MTNSEQSKFWVQCRKCNKPMEGVRKGRIHPDINPVFIRTICEPCGGNPTKYSKKKPIPYSNEWRKLERNKRIAKNAKKKT